MTLIGDPPSTVAECDEQIERVKADLDEARSCEHAIICDCADKLVYYEARRSALLPEQRQP